MSAQTTGVVHEHAVLCRRLGGVQDRVSKLLQEKEMALTALAREVVQLRGQLLVARTSILWGMSLPMETVTLGNKASRPVTATTRPTQGMEAARKAICQTGCSGHAHPWLSDDGHCLWSGRICDGGGD
ncbi:hypothetical protein [Hydrogenophaga sp.]|uniref:hypothetical protein n=1 Tax=Hydrogenophaga sp. TaxID=1904254 RepID=UPI0027303779|nr:hypothetical protein [Hydrogenophaga sp.]MDP1687235.1 hypothetical protein [Hydrogenophaga sp.]